MNSLQVNHNITYASVASGSYKNSLSPASLLSTNNYIYTFSSPFQQYFPLPFYMINYILKYPKSPIGLQKLYKSCKYFYSKNPILIVSGKFPITEKWKQNHILKNDKACRKINTPLLWFIDNLDFDSNFLYDFTKIYRCTITSLSIWEEKLTLPDFKLLVAEGTVTAFVLLNGGKIYDSNENEKEVNVLTILQLLPNIRIFWYYNTRETYTPKILEKMNALKFNNKFQHLLLSLNNAAEDFNANLLFQFIQKNAKNCCTVLIYFGEDNLVTISSKLQAAEKIMETSKEWNDKKIELKFPLYSVF